MKEYDKKEADRQLKKAIREGVKELSEEQMTQVVRLNQLKECLQKTEKLKILGLDFLVEESEKMLSFYDGLIDRKYWNDYALLYVITAIACRFADTVEEACQMYDEFKTMKK